MKCNFLSNSNLNKYYTLQDVIFFTASGSPYDDVHKKLDVVLFFNEKYFGWTSESKSILI